MIMIMMLKEAGIGSCVRKEDRQPRKWNLRRFMTRIYNKNI
jgi:hypothetical protein